MKGIAILMLVTIWTSTLSGQDTTRVAPDSAAHPTALYRDPHRALILGSVIPGAGHIYAGEYLRGILNYEFTVMSIGVGAMVFIVDKCTFSFLSATRCDPGPQWPHQVLGVAVVGVGIWNWVSSARDAARAAERANLRHTSKIPKAAPIIQAPTNARSGWRVGAEIRW
jgi:hypothetical protein